MDKKVVGSKTIEIREYHNEEEDQDKKNEINKNLSPSA